MTTPVLQRMGLVIKKEQGQAQLIHQPIMELLATQMMEVKLNLAVMSAQVQNCLTFPISSNINIIFFIVNCAYDNWSSWSSCSVTCGVGFQISTRPTNQSAINGGDACDGDHTRVQRCGEPCPSGKLKTYLLNSTSLNIM